MTQGYQHFRKPDPVVLALCVVALVSGLGAVGRQGRERARRAVCLSDLQQLTQAWIRYADDNDGNLVRGDTGEYDEFHSGETPWVLRDRRIGMTVAQKQQAIRDGALFPYTGELRLYRCPQGEANETRSYAIVDSMNGKGWLSRAMHKTMGEVQQPDERFVFIDCGGTELIAMGGWTCYPDGREQWWDPPPIRHNDGTVFSFADGHVAYRQWEDARTIEFGKRMVAFSEVQPGNQDIEDTQRGIWGTATDESTEPGRRR